MKRGEPIGASKPNKDSKEIPDRFPRSQDHHELFHKLIDWELEDEMEQVEERLKKWPKTRLAENGLALFDLRARNDGWLFGERVVKLTSDKAGGLPHHRFSQGDIVTMCRKDPLHEKVCEGVVFSRARKHLRVVVSEQPERVRDGTWRLDRGANRVAHDRMADALDDLFATADAAPLADLLLGQPKEMQLAAARIAQMGGQERRLAATPAADKDLNDSQSAALTAALTNRLSLIQGPPGTGKTHTAVRILETWARSGVGPILALADSNVAVDNLLEGMLARGVRAVRIGQPVKVRSNLRDATLAAKMEEHELRGDVETLLKLNEDLLRKMSAFKGKEKGFAHRDLKRGWKEIRRIENQMRDDIIKTAQVVCATCIGVGHRILEGKRFPLVLIDEATQATEPSTLVPLVRGARHLVLVGDHHQLPPTVISQRAGAKGLSRSLFERLVACGVKPVLLNIQYRMHPAIREFPSARFYDNQLEDGVNAAQREPPAGFPWPKWNAPVAFIPVDGAEEVSSDGTSRLNRDEAAIAVRVVEALLSAGDIEPKDIGVVTPYNGQVRLLTDLFEASGGLSERERFDGLEIKSVDGYQGREKEVIILSAVRANQGKDVGFLADWRRLNVAITRAKRGLILLGDTRTLRAESNWAAWLDWASESGLEAWHALHI